MFEREEDQELPTFNEQTYVLVLENLVTNSLVKKAIGHVNLSKSRSNSSKSH